MTHVAVALLFCFGYVEPSTSVLIEEPSFYLRQSYLSVLASLLDA